MARDPLPIQATEKSPPERNAPCISPLARQYEAPASSASPVLPCPLTELQVIRHLEQANIALSNELNEERCLRHGLEQQLLLSDRRVQALTIKLRDCAHTVLRERDDFDAERKLAEGIPAELLAKPPAAMAELWERGSLVLWLCTLL